MGVVHTLVFNVHDAVVFDDPMFLLDAVVFLAVPALESPGPPGCVWGLLQGRPPLAADGPSCTTVLLAMFLYEVDCLVETFSIATLIYWLEVLQHSPFGLRSRLPRLLFALCLLIFLGLPLLITKDELGRKPVGGSC